MSRERARVAVTGIGAVSSLALGARASFARLLAGERGVAPLRRFDAPGVRTRFAAEVRGFELGSEERGSAASRTDAMAIWAAREALGARGPDAGALGVVLGGTAGALFETEEELIRAPLGSPLRGRGLVETPLSSSVLALEAALGPFAAGTTVCSACSSGAVAIALAAEWVSSGRVDAVLAGGADALCRMTFMGFNALGALDPEPCRPFDVGRRGLTLGEGAAFLLLESESSARARGAPVLAWLSGCAVGAEAHHGTHPEPTGLRAAELMSQAIVRAGLTVDEVDYVNAHGTGTTHNDAMEACALHRTFGSQVGRVKVSSSKAQLGHTLGAAGALEAVISVLALESSAAPPTAGLSEPADRALGHVIGSAARGPLRAALSNSFGFGGLDAVLLFEAAPRTARETQRASVPVVVSAVGTPDLDRPDTLDPERSRRFDRLTTGVTQAALLALARAELAPAETGLVVANAYGNVDRSLEFLDRLLAQGPRHAPPAEFPYLVHSAPAGHASIYAGLTGPVFSLCDAELGAEAALGQAVAAIELGLAEALVTGAVEAASAVVQNLRPKSVGRPRGEGGALFAIEAASHASRRGRAALARVLACFEERGLARNDRLLGAPGEPTRSVVLNTSTDPALRERLRGTAWENVAHEVLGSSLGHEALGALAFLRALELLDPALGEHGPVEVLVLSGGASRRFVTRFGRAFEAPP